VKQVSKQTESNPYVNLQGDTLQGPRGMSRQSFLDCVMFHLLTVFLINAAEQEKYYIRNVLKKPQRIGVRQFVHRVEQLNAYIVQMPCFSYSPQANASTKPENVPLPEAELGAHVLHMCPLAWQDQYNLNEKGMTPLDMCTLLTSLEAIERVCTHEKGKQEEKSEKPSFVVGHLELYHTYVLLYRTYILLARLTKVRCETCERARPRSQPSRNKWIQMVRSIPEGIPCPSDPMSVRSQKESYGRSRQS
jgi:hypothetical protein